MKEILTLIIFISNVFQVENDSVLVNMANFLVMQKVNILKETSCRELWIRRLSCPVEVPISLHATC